MNRQKTSKSHNHSPPTNTTTTPNCSTPQPQAQDFACKMPTEMRNRKLNPNTEWLENPYGWAGYVSVILLARLILSYVPFISSDEAWTITNIAHNIITLVAFHFMKGTPFDDDRQGKTSKYTFWEQIDGGIQFSPTKKFLSAVPILLFLISTHFTHYNVAQFAVNFVTLVVVMVPKYPQMHGVRVLGFNKD